MRILFLLIGMALLPSCFNFEPPKDYTHARHKGDYSIYFTIKSQNSSSLQFSYSVSGSSCFNMFSATAKSEIEGDDTDMEKDTTGITFPVKRYWTSNDNNEYHFAVEQGGEGRIVVQANEEKGCGDISRIVLYSRTVEDSEGITSPDEPSINE